MPSYTRRAIPLLVFLLVLLQSTYSNNNIDQLIRKVVNNQNYYQEFLDASQTITKVDDLLIIEQNIGSSNVNVRYVMYSLLYEVAIVSDNDGFRKRCVNRLVTHGTNDSSVENIGKIIEFLMEFSSEDFDSQTRSFLTAQVFNAKVHFNEYVRLAGRIYLEETITFLEERFNKSTDMQEKWIISCSLARMGDPNYVSFSLQTLERIGINDQVVFYILPDILTIPNKDVFDYLFEQILSDNYSCSSLDPEREVTINCAYRLLESVAPYILDFPLQLSESGDLVVSDYEVALEEARQWIHANMDVYQLRQL